MSGERLRPVPKDYTDLYKGGNTPIGFASNHVR
jgi:hypothetical protein